MNLLSSEELEKLGEIDSPTICNAIESFQVRPKNSGYMGPEIRSIIPYKKAIIGYACTAKIATSCPPTEEQRKLYYPYLEKFKAFTVPTVVVVEDTDPEPRACFWGDVHGAIHLALGCVGAITNGCVRDIDTVEKTGFRLFAGGGIVASHAYAHLVEIDCAVNVGGMTIMPGDLIHADANGIVQIPYQVAPFLAEACHEVHAAEKKVIDECLERVGQGIDLQYLCDLREEMYKNRDRKRQC
jgi:regulator of RNase E activity RraA